MRPLIAPSILSANFAKLGEEVDDVLAAGADMVHFDVMDSHYVPNLSVGPLVLRSLRQYGIAAPVDVHLMTQPVDRLIGEFLGAGANAITIHAEASAHPQRSLALIREGGARAGLALNPGESTAGLAALIEMVDTVLVMSVNPGFGGQAFLPSSLDRVRAVKQLVAAGERDIRVQIDGGIKVDNIAAAHEAGADAFVAGSAIFGVAAKASQRVDDYRAVIDAMRAQLTSGGGACGGTR